MASHPFKDIPEGKLESLNALQAQFNADSNPVKCDLMCGVYRTGNGLPFVLRSVKMAKRKIFDDPAWDHEYPPSHLGTKPFRDLSNGLLFGSESQLLCEDRIASMQAIGASGACHMGALFLKHHYGPFNEKSARKVYIPAETWVNHPNVFSHVGIEPVALPYYNASTHALDADALTAAIVALPRQSVIVLQTSGNNPTGCDPTPSEWRMLAQTFRACGHFAFLDAAYLGFVSGSADVDCEAIHIFVEAEVPLLVAATYGKAFGLYGERVGILSVTAPSAPVAERIEKQMKLLARAETGAMPAFGAKILETILGDAEMKRVWEDDLRDMAGQFVERRARLKDLLDGLGTPGNWNFIKEQVGMFTYTGFSAVQIKLLREKYHVYIQDTGRLSIAGLNSSNVEHVARSINAVIWQTIARNVVPSIDTSKVA